MDSNSYKKVSLEVVKFPTTSFTQLSNSNVVDTIETQGDGI